MAGPRYVEIPVAAMLGVIAQVREGVERVGGSVVEGIQGREVVFDITPPSGTATMRVYTSFARGATTLRACDSDAVRIVVGVDHKGRFKTLTKPRKMLRTAPTGLPQETRVTVFLGRFLEAVRDGYRVAQKGATPCPCCKGPMAVRKAKATSSEFLGCINYPECRGTRPINENRLSN